MRYDGQLFRADPAEIILVTDDVILSEIVARLNFNEYQVIRADILDAMPVAAAYIDSLARAYLHDRVVAGEQGRPLHDIPVLGPAFVALQAQSLFRKYGYSFYFMVVGVNEIFEIPPWTM